MCFWFNFLLVVYISVHNQQSQRALFRYFNSFPPPQALFFSSPPICVLTGTFMVCATGENILCEFSERRTDQQQYDSREESLGVCRWQTGGSVQAFFHLLLEWFTLSSAFTIWTRSWMLSSNSLFSWVWLLSLKRMP